MLSISSRAARFTFAGMCACVLATRFVHAQSSPGDPPTENENLAPITFAEALVRAERSPLQRARIEAAEHLFAAAESSPSLDALPTLTVTGGPRLIPESQRGFEGSIGLAQSFSLAGAADARRNTLGAFAREHQAQAQAERLEHTTDAALTWVALHSAQELLAAAHAHAESACASWERLQRLQEAGEITRFEMLGAESDCAEARSLASMQDGAVTELRLHLGRLVHDPNGRFFATGALPNVSAPPFSEDEMLARITHLPSYARDHLVAEALRMRALEEEASQGWRITAGINVQQDDPNGVSVIASVSTNLPIFDVAARNRAEREAEHRLARGTAEEQHITAHAEVRLAFHEVEHWQSILSDREHASASATSAAEYMRTLVAGGDVTILDVLIAERRARSLQVSAIEARGNLLAARIRVLLLAQAVENAEAPR